MQLLLLRHGQPARLKGGHQVDPPLTELGHAQAEWLSRRMAEEKPDVLISSPLTRALQTGAPTADKLGLPIQEIADIAEVDGDANEGGYIHIEDIRAQGGDAWAAFLRDPIGTMGGDEAHFKQRVLRGFSAILEDYKDAETVAVFTHGFPINALLSHVLGLTSISRFIPAHGSITRLGGRSTERMVVISVNETGHFPVHGLSVEGRS
ncbi:MAG: histidine phosphatase family protein [Litorimonas sp.]